MLGAIDSLALMIESPGGDLEAKATLAMTTYRVAARTKGLTWADVRFASIFPRLREHALASARAEAVEKILHGIPEVQRLQRASEAATHDVEALAVLVRGMASLGTGAAPSTEDLLDALLTTDEKQNPRDSRAERLERVGLYLMGEVRRLRARVAELEPASLTRCDICGQPAMQSVKVILGQRWSPRCEAHCQ